MAARGSIIRETGGHGVPPLQLDTLVHDTYTPSLAPDVGARFFEGFWEI